MKTTRVLAPAAVALTAIVMATAAPAVAKDGRVTTSGKCSSAATWKLKASPENGRIEVEAEVDSNRAGQTWRWSLKQNGKIVGSGKRKTVGRSGSFEVRRVLPNKAGTDTFVLNARHGTQVCRGTVRF